MFTAKASTLIWRGSGAGLLGRAELDVCDQRAGWNDNRREDTEKATTVT